MENAIVIVSVSPGGPKSGILTLQQKIVTTYPNEKVFFAYTGSHILKQHPEWSLQEVFHRLNKHHFDKILVVPLYLLTGTEYEKVSGQVLEKTAVILPVPMSKEQNRRLLAQTLMHRFPKETGKGWLFVGHGSQCSNYFYRSIQAEFWKSGRKDCFVITLLDSNTVQECIAWACNQGEKKLGIVPLMLGSGKHTMKDIFGSENSLETRLQQAGFSTYQERQDLGNLDVIQQFYLEEIKIALR